MEVAHREIGALLGDRGSGLDLTDVEVVMSKKAAGPTISLGLSVMALKQILKHTFSRDSEIHTQLT
jgi:hypothetical protein